MKFKVFAGGYAPQRAHFSDAGIDFRTPVAFTLAPGEAKVIDLLVAAEIPVGMYGLFESKSGLMTKHHIVVEGGTIDAGFRGSIKISMANHGTEPYHFFQGDKIAQMVVMPCDLSSIDVVESLDEPDDGRGTDGYGSTGR